MPYERGSRTTVLLVDDDPIFTEALELVLAPDERLHVVGRGGTGTEAVELTVALRPDAVLLDLHMPGMDGAETARRILDRLPATAVVVLSSSGEREDVERSLSAGACAYLTKDVDAATLAATIVAAAGSGPPAARGPSRVSGLVRRLLGPPPAPGVAALAVTPVRVAR